MTIKKNGVRETSLTRNELLDCLKALLVTSGGIRLSDVPDVLHDDLVAFMSDKNLSRNSAGDIIIAHYDYQRWLEKITLRDDGFDYDFKVKYS